MKTAARRKATPLSDDDLVVLIESYEAHATTHGVDRADRRKALSYYQGEPFGDEVEGRSQVVSREVADTIEWIKPSLMRIFASGDEVVRFDPHGAEDLEQAEQESDVLNWYVLQKNNAFAALYTWFTDGLLSRNGYIVAYWDDSTDVSTESYERLSVQEFQMLEQDDEVEIIEGPEITVEEEWTERPDPMTGMMVSMPIPVEYYEVTVRRTKTRGTMRYKCLPPEQVIIDSRHHEVCLADADFAGYWEHLTISQLRQMFPDADIPDDVEDGGGAGYEIDATRHRERLIGSGRMDRDENVDPSMRLVRVTTAWMRADRDGDGIAERRHVVKVGRMILHDEPTDIVQMASLSPIIFPHRHEGVSMFDLVADLQEIKTMMLRSMIDSAFLANNGRLAVNADRVNLDDLLVSRPGGAVRTVGDPAGAVMPLNHPYIGNQITNTLDYLDAVGEKRTGVTKYNQGLDANTLNKTATGISLITQAASQRIELIARVFAETGVKDLFLIGHSLIRKHGSRDMVVKLRNQWIPIDPRSWVKRYDLSVAVGLGTGDRQAQAQSLTLISQLQNAYIQAGTGLVSKKNLFDTAAKFVQSGGWKDVSSFFTDPSQPVDAQQEGDPRLPMSPPPDPRAASEQQRAQLDQQRLQVELLREQNAGQKALIDAELRRYEIDRKAEVEASIAQYQADLQRDAKVQTAMIAEQGRQVTESMRAQQGQQVEQVTSAATEAARVPVLETALEALAPVVQQIGALANATQQRARAKSFKVVRNPDGSKDITEI